MLNYFSQAYLFSSFSCVFWKFHFCSVKCLPWFNLWFSSLEWRFLFLQEARKLWWESLENVIISTQSLKLLFSVTWSPSFYTIVLGVWCFISAFCPSSVLWIFKPYLFGCIFATHFIPWEWVAESVVVMMWWNLRVVCASKWHYRSNWSDGSLKCAETCHKNCAWCVWNSGSTHCSKTGQDTSLKLSRQLRWVHCPWGYSGRISIFSLLYFAVGLVMNSGKFCP